MVENVRLFLQEMESGSIASFAPENMIKIVDVSKGEEDDQVSDIRPDS